MRTWLALANLMGKGQNEAQDANKYLGGFSAWHNSDKKTHLIIDYRMRWRTMTPYAYQHGI